MRELRRSDIHISLFIDGNFIAASINGIEEEKDRHSWHSWRMLIVLIPSTLENNRCKGLGGGQRTSQQHEGHFALNVKYRTFC